MFSPACAVVHKCPLFAHFLLGRRSKRLSRRLVSLNKGLANALIPYKAMKYYVYKFKRLDLKRFKILKIADFLIYFRIPFRFRLQFSDLICFLKDIGY